MSKKTSKKTIKKVVSKKKAGTSKSSKPSAKKSKVVKKIAAKKPVAKKQKPTAAKKNTVKKKVVTAKKVVAKKKVSKPVAKKIQLKKAAQVKKIAKPVVKEKAVVVKKQKAEKPEKAVKPSKVAVTKSTSQKNLKPIFQPAKKNTIDNRIEKQTPDPAGKFELEYIVHTSTPILFEFLTTPSGLSEWFCDDVDIRDNVYSFQWDENAQKARLVRYVEESVARFQWVDKTDNTYFEFRIERDDLTNDISLIVADFADTPEDKRSSTLLWDSQIDKLLSVLGSH